MEASRFGAFLGGGGLQMAPKGRGCLHALGGLPAECNFLCVSPRTCHWLKHHRPPQEATQTHSLRLFKGFISSHPPPQAPSPGHASGPVQACKEQDPLCSPLWVKAEKKGLCGEDLWVGWEKKVIGNTIPYYYTCCCSHNRLKKTTTSKYLKRPTPGRPAPVPGLCLGKRDRPQS